MIRNTFFQFYQHYCLDAVNVTCFVTDHRVLEESTGKVRCAH